jgi:hypothetical protein
MIFALNHPAEWMGVGGCEPVAQAPGPESLEGLLERGTPRLQTFWAPDHTHVWANHWEDQSHEMQYLQHWSSLA